MEPTDDLFSVQHLTKCRLRGKWIPLVAYLLRDGRPQRYAELKGQIPGISQKMLTQTLRQLEDEGVVSRTVYPTVPPTVEYALTPKGKRLIEPLLAMAEKLFPQDEPEEGLAP
jgi:DNA-binding HxlR family transcriptional regulator